MPNTTNPASNTTPSRRRFLQASIAGAVGTAMRLTLSGAFDMAYAPKQRAASAAADFELEEFTIADLQKGLASGKFTAGLLPKYLARIEQVDRRGPAVNSVIEVNPDAASIAEALDKERKAKGTRGTLHGIPVLIKDNIDTADRMQTTAGSLALLGSRPTRDSYVAQNCVKRGR